MYLDSLKAEFRDAPKKLNLTLVKLVKLQVGGFISAVWLLEDTMSPVPWAGHDQAQGGTRGPRAVNDSSVLSVIGCSGRITWGAGDNQFWREQSQQKKHPAEKNQVLSGTHWVVLKLPKQSGSPAGSNPSE